MESQPIETSRTPENATPPEWYENLSGQEEYKNSVLIHSLSNQAAVVGWDRLAGLFTDIDGTWIYKLSSDEKKLPKDEQQKLADPYIKSADKIVNRLSKKSRPIIGVTGRDLSMIKGGQIGGAVYDIEHLPQFPVAAEALGTTIQVLQQDGTYQLDQEWEDIIRNEIGFDRDYIYGHPGSEGSEATGCFYLIDEVNTRFPTINFRFQPRDEFSNVQAWKDDPDGIDPNKPDIAPQDKKISFFSESTPEEAAGMKKAIHEILASPQIDREKVKVIISHDADLTSGVVRFNIDLVPVSKQDAIEFMAKKYHIKAIVAGDSGNDADMIANAEGGIVVGGVKAELTQQLTARNIFEGIVKKTLHFQRRNKDESANQLLYTEPKVTLQASTSLDRAVHAFELLDTLAKR